MKIALTVWLVLATSSAFASSWSCEADCQMTCETILFAKSPDRFSDKECADLGGGFGGYSGGKYICIKYSKETSQVNGSSNSEADAMRNSYNQCLRTTCGTRAYGQQTTNYRCSSY